MSHPIVLEQESYSIRSEGGVFRALQSVRQWAVQLGFSRVDQARTVTAASELAHNVIEHGGGGTMRAEVLGEGTRRGLRLTFEDHGPGISDLEQALKDGYSTSRSLGVGLGGAKRLSGEFEIVSRVGEGTRVSITNWK